MRADPAFDVDLVIVGGGPAGLSTALFLTHAAPRLRDRILVLERATYPREKICAGAVGARADRLLASIGVRIDVPHVPMRGLSVRAHGKTLCVRRDGPIIGRVLRRIEFDHAFAQTVMARGVQVRDGVKVENVVVDSNSVHLTTSVGAIRARAVVGADGVGSVVRRATGFSRGVFMAQAMEVDTISAVGDGHRDILHFDLEDPGLVGYAWDFPTVVRGEHLVCRGIYELRGDGVPERPGGSPSVAERLERRLERLGVTSSDHGVRRFAERGVSFSEPLSRPRVLLVGEAAGIDPVLGEGIAQAIQYGAVAGPYLARCLAVDELSFAQWNEHVRRTRLGLDLAVRSRLARHVYGFTRPLVERFVTNSEAIVAAGMNWFAGDRIPRRLLAKAAMDLTGAGLAWTLSASDCA